MAGLAKILEFLQNPEGMLMNTEFEHDEEELVQAVTDLWHHHTTPTSGDGNPPPPKCHKPTPPSIEPKEKSVAKPKPKVSQAQSILALAEPQRPFSKT